MKVDVKPIKYVGNGEAVVELNTGQRVDIFVEEADEYSVSLEDITGAIGSWLEQDTSDIPVEAVELLQKAYSLCAKLLE